MVPTRKFERNNITNVSAVLYTCIEFSPYECLHFCIFKVLLVLIFFIFFFSVLEQGYSWEITTAEGGYGLHELLGSRKIVVNGKPFVLASQYLGA